MIIDGKDIKVLCVIPSRWDSSRFPGKPLALLGEKPVVQWVYESARRAFDDVIIATDDDRIRESVENFGGIAMMTSKECENGTMRCAEAVSILGKACDVIVNLQGDEPFIDHEDLKHVVEKLITSDGDVATMTRVVTIEENDLIFDDNVVKVVVDDCGVALYFSRLPIPYIRNMKMTDWSKMGLHRSHSGVYAYSPATLKQLTLPCACPLSNAENLEQLKWIEMGKKIVCFDTNNKTIGIDTPHDLENANKFISYDK